MEWGEPDPRFLRADLPPPPEPPLLDVLGAKWAAWLTRAADAKAAPPDYVLAGLLASAGALIGNTRWVAPWSGWAEPPIIWAMVIGAPSANKSPGLDAILSPLKQVERALRLQAATELSAWAEKAEIAKLAESTWKEAAKEALKGGKEPPAKPPAATPGPEPFTPRLSVADSTVERLAVILSRQPRGTLLARDELAGWLHGMTRYSNGGSDRPFWLEAYGGRSFTVERMGRRPSRPTACRSASSGESNPNGSRACCSSRTTMACWRASFPFGRTLRRSSARPKGTTAAFWNRL